MPVVTVNLWEEVLDENTEPKVVAALTEGLVSVFGEQIRPFTTVLVVGVPQRRWGVGGIPSDTAAKAV